MSDVSGRPADNDTTPNPADHVANLRKVAGPPAAPSPEILRLIAESGVEPIHDPESLVDHDATPEEIDAFMGALATAVKRVDVKAAAVNVLTETPIAHTPDRYGSGHLHSLSADDATRAVEALAEAGLLAAEGPTG